jgi:hypothetical protein
MDIKSSLFVLPDNMLRLPLDKGTLGYQKLNFLNMPAL